MEAYEHAQAVKRTMSTGGTKVNGIETKRATKINASIDTVGFGRLRAARTLSKDREEFFTENENAREQVMNYIFGGSDVENPLQASFDNYNKEMDRLDKRVEELTLQSKNS